MSKQETLRYDGMSLFVDGVEAERITSVSVSRDQGFDNILQLGDSGIVDKIAQTPDVTVTVESNFVGSFDLLKMMADRLITPSGAGGTDDIRYSVDGTYERFDRINVGSANGSDRDVDHLDLLNSYVDLTIPVRYDTTSVGYTIHIHRAALTSYSLSADVTGNATETFNLSAGNLYRFHRDWRGVRPYVVLNGEVEAKSATASGALSQVFSVDSAAIPIGSSVIGVFVDRHTAFIGNTTDWTFYSSPAAVGGNFTFRLTNDSATGKNTDWANPFVSSPSSTTRPKVYLMYYDTADSPTFAGTATSDWGFELTHTAGSLGALAKQYIVAYLWNTNKDTYSTSTTQGKLLRLQSFNIDVSPESEPKYQMGEKEPYSIFRKTPVNVTGSFSLLASDLQPVAILCSTTDANEVASGGTMLTADHFNAYNYFKIKFYRDEAQTTLLSSAIVSNFSVSNESISINVGGEAAEQFSFEADNFTANGTGTNPNG